MKGAVVAYKLLRGMTMKKNLIRTVVVMVIVIPSIFAGYLIYSSDQQNNKYQTLETQNKTLKADFDAIEAENKNMATQLEKYEKQSDAMKVRLEELEALKDEVYDKVDGLPISLSGEWTADNMSIKTSNTKEKSESLKNDFERSLNQVEEAHNIFKYLPTLWPADSKGVSSNFGKRNDPVYSGNAEHKGVDIAGSIGQPVYASADGIVEFVGEKGGYGNAIMISHGNGYQTLYGHLSKASVKTGQAMEKGDTIGKIGSTGKSTGPHLHFEIIETGTEINPISFLKKYE